MKDYYMIGEISRLYGIGADSLMYYERLGLLRPRRDSNNYRLYSLNDIYRLNVIRDLRELGFPMGRIKAYLESQSLKNTAELLAEEQKVIDGQLQKLRGRRAIIKRRLAALERIISAGAGTAKIKHCPPRRCVRLNEYITRDEEMDFFIKKLHRLHEDSIRDFGSLEIGGLIAMSDVEKGLSDVYRSVFFIMEDGEDWDFTLPAGSYISYCYRGGYSRNIVHIMEAIDKAAELGYVPAGDPFEIYEADNRITALPEEFLTEIQIPAAEIELDNTGKIL